MKRTSLALCSLALVAGCASSDRATTPTSPKASDGGFGVIVMAHGGSPEWNDAVAQAVAPLRAKYEIEIAYGMADATTMQDAVSKLEARNVHRIGVVRLFVSGESWYERTEQIFGLRDGAPPAAAAGHDAHAGHGGHDAHAGHAAKGGHDAHAGHAAKGGHDAHAGHGTKAGHDAHAGHDAKAAGHDAHAAHGAAAHGGHGGHSMAFFRVATSRAKFELSKDGLVDEPGMGQVLAERAAALSKDPSREDVLVLAHGPGDDDENARWLAKLDERAKLIREKTPFRRVQVETLREDWPDKRKVAEERIRAYVARAAAEGGTAIVVPFRVQGFGPYKEVLGDLAYVSDGKGLIPHEQVGAWIERQIAELATRPFAR